MKKAKLLRIKLNGRELGNDQSINERLFNVRGIGLLAILHLPKVLRMALQICAHALVLSANQVKKGVETNGRLPSFSDWVRGEGV